MQANLLSECFESMKSNGSSLMVNGRTFAATLLFISGMRELAPYLSPVWELVLTSQPARNQPSEQQTRPFATAPFRLQTDGRTPPCSPANQPNALPVS